MDRYSPNTSFLSYKREALPVVLKSSSGKYQTKEESEVRELSGKLSGTRSANPQQKVLGAFDFEEHLQFCGVAAVCAIGRLIPRELLCVTGVQEVAYGSARTTQNSSCQTW